MKVWTGEYASGCVQENKNANKPKVKQDMNHDILKADIRCLKVGKRTWKERADEPGVTITAHCHTTY